jgi:hypothetical protein
MTVLSKRNPPAWEVSDFNNSNHYFGFPVFSVSWGICFSLEPNPNSSKEMDSGTVLAQGKRLLLQHVRQVFAGTIAETVNNLC